MVASGINSVICGGQNNIGAGAHCFVGGGLTNENNSQYSVICGGNDGLIASGSTYGVVCGGRTNQIQGSGDYIFIGGGQANDIGASGTSTHSCICGGNNNNIDSLRCFIGGGTTNDILGSGVDHVICGGSNNNIAASCLYGFMGGGLNNDIDSSNNYAVVCGGTSNLVTASQGTICGGNNNEAASNAFVGGGSTNNATETNAVVCGGATNTAANSAVVCGGSTNTASGATGFIGGGSSNDINSTATSTSGICCGNDNTINASASDAFIGGGENNSLSGQWSVICGGKANVTGTLLNQFIGGGNTNYSNEVSTVVCGGSANNTNGATVAANGTVSSATETTAGEFTFIGGGKQNQTTGDLSAIVGGWYGLADKYGQQAHANGRFANDGDAQTSVFVLRTSQTHSTNTWRSLALDGSSADMTVPTDTVWTFDCLLVGTTQGCTKSFGWKIRGTIENDGGTTTMLASTVTLIYDTDDTSFDAQAIADDADNSLKIQVQDTDATGDVVRWVARVETAEVNFPA
jgi:hypothetical protein